MNDAQKKALRNVEIEAGEVLRKMVCRFPELLDPVKPTLSHQETADIAQSLKEYMNETGAFDIARDTTEWGL